MLASCVDSALDLVSGSVLWLTQRFMAKADPFVYPEGKSRYEPIGIVLFSSTELPELVGLCDRIIVFYQGRIAGELSGVADHTLLHVINTGEMPVAATEPEATS